MENDIVNNVKSQALITAAIGIISFGAGVGVGYILRSKVNMERHEEPEQLFIDYDEVEEYISFHENSDMVEKDNTQDDSIVKTFIEQLADDIVITEQDTVQRTIFASGDDFNWDYESELRSRNPGEPYILHRDEFYSDEVGYTQSVLTFYSGDNIMVDEDDSPIYNYQLIVGELRFGHGSSDPNVFYVRNDSRKAEYEILCDSGLYSVEVLGIDLADDISPKDVKHSNNKKFKSEE